MIYCNKYYQYVHEGVGYRLTVFNGLLVLLLTSHRRHVDVDTGDSGTSGSTSSNTAVALSCYDILQSLHLKHCALVVLSRGCSVSNITTAQPQSQQQQQQQQAAETLNLSDTFLAAGAKVLVTMLYSQLYYDVVQ
jgi:hypothetical protein